MTRDEYVQKLKAQIDQWNTHMAKWDSASQEVKNKYLQQFDEARVRRDEAIEEMKRLQGASADAWMQMMKGAETAFTAMQSAFERAKQGFEKK
jgi:hypothetical protein